MAIRRVPRIALEIGVGALIVLACVVGWYLATPGMTVRAMADAAARGDAAGVVAHMDMDALRRDARRRMSSELARLAPEGRVRLDHDRITDVLVGRVIDRVFSNRGADRIYGRPRTPPRTTVPDVVYRIRRLGPNNFVATIYGARRVDLRFTRSGLAWKLTGVVDRTPAAGSATLV